MGLDGTWGSGKSNLISIVKDTLGIEYHTFIYDAWSHQEDLQRRSFLEELTEDLQINEVIEPKKWEENLKDLLAKKKETLTKTIPKLSYPIIISFLVLISVPLAKVMAEAITNHFWKIIVTASPVILALLGWAIAAFKNPVYRNITNLFYLYIEKDLEKKIDEIISEKEPSVREFRKWMIKLSKDLNKKVIIVFDNMDRLPADKVQHLWSSIHTFFSEKHYDNIWVIVPFDRNHIKDAFNDGGESGNKGSHFINKTFSVIFNVSPPASTDWKKFFKAKYKYAFGETENTDYVIIKNIFDLYTDDITPRKIIAFINDLVSIKLVWKEEIQLKYVALFTLNKETILQDPVKEIVKKKYLTKANNVFRYDDDVSDNIAALVYNVPLKDATEITLYRSILISIRNKEEEKLKILSEHSGFYEILEQVISKEEEMPVDATVLMLNCISEMPMDEGSKEIISLVWDIAGNKQISTPIDDQHFSDIHKILLSKSSLQKSKSIVSYIISRFATSRNFKGDTYFDCLDKMKLFVVENKLEIPVNSLIEEKNLSPEMFIDFVKAAKNKFSEYKVSCDRKNLEAHFINGFPANLKDSVILKYIKADYEFKELKIRIEKYIKEESIILENFMPVFDTYKAIVNDKPFSQKLADSTIHTLIAEAPVNSNNYFELSAMRLARGSTYEETGGKSDSILLLTNESIVSKVASIIEYYVDFGDLLLEVITWQKPLLQKVLKEILKQNHDDSVMNIEKVLPNFEKLKEIIDVTDEELLLCLDDWSSFLKTELTKDTLTTVIPNISLYSIALKLKNELTDHIFETALDFIKVIEHSAWVTYFSDNASYPFQLITFLLQNDKLQVLPTNAVSAYKEVLKVIADGTLIKPLSSKDLWDILFEHTEKIHLSSTIKNIRDSFILNTEITIKQFDFFEMILRKEGDLNTRSGDVVRRIFTPVAKEDACLNMMVNNAEYYALLIYQAGDDGIDFIELLRKRIEREEDNKDLKEFSHQIDALLSTDIEICEANYYTEEKTVDVIKVFSDIIDVKKILHFKIGNDMLEQGNPYVGQPRNVYVAYKFKGKDYSLTVEEGKWISFP